MPIYTVEAPNGKVYELEGPEGSTPEQLSSALYSQVPDAATPFVKESGVIAQGKKGLEQLISGFQTTGEAALGDKNEAARAALARQAEFDRKYEQSPSLERTAEAFKEKGFLSGLGQLASDAPDVLAAQIPQFGLSYAGGRAGAAAGAKAGSALGPRGRIAGALLGGVAGTVGASYPGQLAGNIETQAEEQVSKGKPIDINLPAAAGTAVPQAALDAAANLPFFGRGLFGKMLGIPKEVLERGSAEAVEKLAKESLAATISKGTAVGYAAEFPTEILQQVLQRYQAGQSLTSPEAYKQYGEIAYQTALLSPLGTAGRSLDKRGAKAQVQQKVMEQRREADAAAAAAAPKPPDITSPDYLQQVQTKYQEAEKLKTNLKSQLRKVEEDSVTETADRLHNQDIQEQIKAMTPNLEDLAKKYNEAARVAPAFTPEPVPEIVETPEAVKVPEAPKPTMTVGDALDSPLGRFTKEELSSRSPKVVNFVDEHRKKLGKPALNDYSIEDIRDAMPGQLPDAEKSDLNSLIAAKTGYTPDVTYKPEDIINIARQKNIATNTDGFKFFLQRATGDNDLTKMEQPQLHSAFTALSGLPEFDETQYLPEKTSATDYSPQQYNLAVQQVSALASEKDIPSSQALQVAKKATGLTRDSDVQLLLQNAYTSGDLNLSSKGDFITAQPAEQAEFRVEEGFAQAQPTGFNVMRGDQLLFSTQNQDEANAKVESLGKTADPAMKQIDKSIASERSTIAASQRSLDIMETAGLFRTPKYQQASAQHAALVQKSNDDIQRLNEKKAYLQLPVTIQTTGKPSNVRVYKAKEKGVSEKAFNTREEALKHALENLPVARLNELAGKTKAPGFSKRLKAEIERRQNPPKQFVAAKPEVAVRVEPQEKSETTSQKEAFRSQLLPMLKKFGLGDVALQIEEGMKAEGSYAASVIKVALDANNPVRVLRHESLHGLKDLGFFTPGQWKVLENQADKVWIDKYLKQRNINGQPIQGGQQSRFEAYQNLYNGDMDAIREEAIADAFGDFDINGAPKGLFATLLQKMQDFFRALRSAFTGAGYETADDVFGKVERGELKATKPTAPEEEKLSLRTIKDVLDDGVERLVASARKQNVRDLQDRYMVGLAKADSNFTKIQDGIEKRLIALGVPATSQDNNDAFGMVYNKVLPAVREQLRKDAQERNKQSLNKPSADNAWKADEKTIKAADDYEAENGIRPYVSEGFLDLPKDGTKYSIQSYDPDKHLSYDAVLGMPINQNGTVTLYYHTTKENSVKISNKKVIPAEGRNRIYLTNESVGADVLRDRGNFDQELDGSTVLVYAHPDMLQMDDTEYKNGRKDFYIPLAQGDFFNKKMKLQSIQKSRTSPITDVFSYSDHEVKITDAVKAYKDATPAERRKLLSDARKTLKQEHNVSSLLSENGKLEKTRVGEYDLDWDGNSVASMGLGLASAQQISDKVSTCPRSAICEGLCLGETSGGNLMFGGAASEDVNDIQKSSFRAAARMMQYLKTEALVIHPKEFATLLQAEIDSLKKWCESETQVRVNKETKKRYNEAKEIYQPAVRLNVTSDFKPAMFRAIIDENPDIEFYDYTKLGSESIADNHHLTYSSTGFGQIVKGEKVFFKDKSGNYDHNWATMRKRLDNGQNVAMAFSSKSGIPSFLADEETGNTYRVWNGDDYDARFLDPKQPDGKGMVIGLKNKAGTLSEKTATQKTGGFFVHYDPKTDGDTVVVPDQQQFQTKPKKVFEIKPEKLSLRTAPDTPEFKRWFGDSKIVTSKYTGPVSGTNVMDWLRIPEDEQINYWGNLTPQARTSLMKDYRNRDGVGNPKIMYHGTARDITTFKPKQAGAIFLTDDIDFAEGFASMSADWMAKNVDEFLTPQQKKDAVQLAIKNVKADYGKTKASVSIIKDLQSGNPTGEAMDKLVEAYREMMPSGPNVMPVYVRAENPFDYENPDHIRAIEAKSTYFIHINPIIRGDWKTIESKRIQELIKEAGFDSFYVQENGRKNLAVYDSSQIKSAIGNIGTYDSTNPDIRYSLRTAPDTPEFKRWFKESKAVDENGKPILMYHGTNRDFNEPRTQSKGAFFVTPSLNFANKYAANDLSWFSGKKPKAGMDYVESGANVMPVWVSVQNPFDYNNKEHIDKIIPALRKALKEEESYGNKEIANTIQNLRQGNYRAISLANDYDVISKAGFDGFWEYEANVRNLGVFKPEQIKSAIGNTGAFDATNPDIRYSLRSAPDTPEFKQWFGNSEVVDENGKPMVVYHSTPKFEGNAFRYDVKKKNRTDNVAGFYFAPSTRDPDDYAVNRETGEYGKGAQVIPVYLSIKNPYIYGKSKVTKAMLDQYREELIADNQHMSDEKVKEWSESKVKYFTNGEVPFYGDGDSKQRILKAGGYDGFLDGRHWVAFESNQVKSAIGNSGQFDVNNPDIRYSLRTAPDWVPQNIWDLHEKASRAEDLASGRIATDARPQDLKREQTMSFRRLNKAVEDYVGKDFNDVNALMVRMNEETGRREREQEDQKPARFSLRTDVAEDIRNMPNGAAIEAAINRTTTARQELGYAERMTTALANRSESFSYFRQKFFDRYNRLNDVERQIAQQMGGVARLADQSAHAAALQSDAAAGVAASALGVGNRMGGMPVYRNGYTTVSNENGTVKGAVEIFSPLAKYGDPKIYQAYQFWAGAKRGNRLITIGKEELYTPQDMALAKQLCYVDAKGNVSGKYPEFASVQKDWIKYNDGLVKYAVDTGVISAQNAAEFTRYSDYVPFYRQLEGERTVGPNIFQSISGVKPPKELTGSKEQLADFLETIVRNTQSIIQAGMKNVAAQKAIDGGMIVGMVRKLDHLSSHPDTVTILEKGKKVSYECADKLWVDAVSSLNLPELPFLNFIAAPANLLRTMVTKDPGFMLANLMRDSISAYVTSGAKLTPVASAVKEFGNVLMNNSPEYQKLLSAGVLGGYEFSRNVEASAEAFGKDLREKTGTKTSFESATSPFTFFWNALEKGTEASDAATRIAVYKATLAETGNEAEAIHRALEVMNFNRKGSSVIVRVAAAAIPFLNARVQGLDVFFRSGIRPFLDGNATEQEKQVQKAMIIRGMTILSLSVMYAAAISGNPDYENQEEETKDNNWIIPMGEGKTPLKIPIPFEVGTLFKTVPERIYRSFFMPDQENRDTTEALQKSMKRALQSTFGFNPVPQIAAPLLEARDNYSVFTQRPIVGQNMQGISPEFQVGPGTSKWAEILGQQAGMSPMMIDHVFKGYTGTMGVYAADLLDAAIGAASPSEADKPSKRIDQMPIIKRFLANPEARGKITSYFELKHQVDTTVRTINLLEKQADPNLPNYVEKNAQLFAARDFMNNLNKQMDELQQQANMIRFADIPANEKRDMLAEITKAQNLLVNDIRQIRNILKP